MSIEIDENTGLPQLPENMFWRVVDDGRWGMNLYLMRNRDPGLFGRTKSPLIMDSVFGLREHPGDRGHLPRQIRSSAYRIMSKRNAKDFVKKLTGDYPPNRLETR